MPKTKHHLFETAFGYCTAAWSEGGLTRFLLPLPDREQALSAQKKALPHSVPTEPVDGYAEMVASIRRYFAGEREDFSDLELDLSGIDAFRIALYTAMRRLGYGETTTYGALSASAGFPGEARRTGNAMGRNPLPLIIPCHRVLAAGGQIGGFSAPGGRETKRRMLALERARPPDFVVEQTSFPF